MTLSSVRFQKEAFLAWTSTRYKQVMQNTMGPATRTF